MFKLLKKQLRRSLGFSANKKHEMLSCAFPAIRSWGITGDYFEFGVYRASTSIEAYKMSRKCNLNLTFFLFDSFEGIPENAESTDKFYTGQYSCSLDDVKKILESNRIDLTNFRFVSGFYSESLTENLQKTLSYHKASIVWIDCDLYSSTVNVLKFITPFLQIGTIICFDDWFSFGGDLNKGEIRAFNEWLSLHPLIKTTHYRDFGTSGRSFVISSYH